MSTLFFVLLNILLYLFMSYVTSVLMYICFCFDHETFKRNGKVRFERLTWNIIWREDYDVLMVLGTIIWPLGLCICLWYILQPTCIHIMNMLYVPPIYIMNILESIQIKKINKDDQNE